MKFDYIIMCGGEGNRLKPFTYIIPKPFLTTSNVSPFDYILKNINFKKTQKVFVTLKYKYHIAKKIIERKKNPKIKMFYERNTSGTAGCIRELVKKKITNNFLVINGDIFTKLNFSKMMQHHIKGNYDLTVGITNYQLKLPYAVLKKKKNKHSFIEKPKFNKKINAGVYAISKKYALKYFKKFNKEEINMTDLIDDSKKIGIYDIGEKWIDIGHIDDFKKANVQLKKW